MRPDFRGLTHPPDMPIGLLYIAAHLEKYGFKPEVFDLNVQEMPDFTQYDVVGISMLPLARKQAYELIEELKSKKPGIRIVLGGVFPSSIPEYLIKHLKIDAIVVGEGDETFVELMQYWDDFGLHSDIPIWIHGLCTLEHGMHEPRKLLDINKLPFPAYHHSDFNWFKMTFAKNFPDFTIDGITLSKERVAMISGSRGCPNLVKQCQFCDTPRFWQYKYRFRSAESILNEIEGIYRDYGVRTFSFNDDAFPVSKSQCLEFCNGVLQRGLKIAWKSDTRADVIDDEMAELMRKSGCFMVAIGVESASEKIRNTIHKNLDIEKAKKTIHVLKKHGILAYVLLMVGNPGESKETIEETRQFLIETQPDLATWVTGVMICPGTELYDLAKRQGLIEDSYWIQKTNGMPVYHGELSPSQISALASQLQGWKNGY